MANTIVDSFMAAVRNLSARIHALEVKENSPSTLGIFYTTFASLGTGKEGQFVKCTNCRKGAEGAGAGTGCLVYWNTATSTWKRVYDNADANA